MSAVSDLTGKRFERWYVLKRDGSTKQGKALWLCECDCGNKVQVNGVDLRMGKSRSCGCLRNDASAERWKAIRPHLIAPALKHGHCSQRNPTKEYRTWRNMLDRCSNKKSARFKQYGGRGVTVCDRWQEDFLAFLSDMGLAPGPEYSMDRIDNDGNYEPGNCRWADASTQAANKQKTIRVEIDGQVMCLSHACKKLGIDRRIAGKRLRRGEPIAAVLLGEAK